MTETLLSAVDITVTFGGVRAVSGVTLEIGGNEVVGLVGPNGSGKSTLLNAVTGLVHAEGSLMFNGHPLAFNRPATVKHRGISRTFQTAQVIGELTCAENVLLATSDRHLVGLTGAWLRRRSMGHHERQRWSQARDALTRVGLESRLHTRADALPAGNQRLLEIARALVATPKLILLDEPSAGLNAAETESLGTLLGSIAADDVSLVIVDHKVGFLNSLCDRLVVLQLGSVIAQGPPAEVWQDPRVADAYLGGSSHAS